MREHYEAYWNRENPPPVTDPLAGTRATLLFEKVESLGLEGGRFLDVGCGDGWLVGQAQSRGFAAEGMDLSQAVVDLAKARYPASTFWRSGVDDRPWPVAPASFDVVSSFEVVEHLLDPSALIAGMRAALKPGGHMAMTTPYHGLVKNVAIAVLGFDRHFSVTGDHIRFFSDAALKHLVEGHGFHVEELLHYGRAPFVWSGVMVWASRR